jgi:hypothetical protein
MTRKSLTTYFKLPEMMRYRLAENRNVQALKLVGLGVFVKAKQIAVLLKTRAEIKRTKHDKHPTTSRTATPNLENRQ